MTARASSNILERLTADPTLGDGTTPGKPPELGLCGDGGSDKGLEARGIIPVSDCCETTDMDTAITHGVDLDRSLDDSGQANDNRVNTMVDSNLANVTRTGDEGKVTSHKQISSIETTGVLDVSLTNASFRDKVVGKSMTASVVSEIPELDILIGDDDVRLGVEDGTPTIDFSDRLHHLIDKKLASSIVVRLLGRSIGYYALLSHIKALWRPIGEIALIDLDNDYFLVRFAKEEDCSRVLMGVIGLYTTVTLQFSLGARVSLLNEIIHKKLSYGLIYRVCRINIIPRAFLLDPKFNRFLRCIIRLHDLDVVAFMETHVSGRQADKIIRRHGFAYSFWVEATCFSGGIWLLWKDNLRIDVLVVSNQFIHTRCVESESGFGSHITFVYASPTVRLRNLLWDQLEALSHGKDYLWLLGGDFNAILNSSERMGGSDKMDGVCRRFGEFLLQAQLMDLGFQGPSFTWKRGLLHQRLDKCLANVVWQNTWPDSFVLHLARMGSNHRPVLLSNVVRHTRQNSTSFKYLATWQSETSFGDMLRTIWNDNNSLLANVTSFQEQARIWNKDMFGHIGQWKRRLLARIEGVEKALESSNRHQLVELELELKRS
ncbi:hypothetical protein GQ457_01G028250 [Hibiscus cannabinus]